MELIDGKKVSDDLKEIIAKETKAMFKEKGRTPHLAAVLVGDDPASHTYVANKERACKEVGFLSSIYRYPASISEKELLDVINFLNKDEEIDGFIVQSPLPKHIDDNKIIEMIEPSKDVDGFHPVNLGRMLLGMPAFLSATPFGIIQLLQAYNIETSGKNCVVVGRSHLVGTPVSILLSRASETGNATVTLCHSKTKNLSEITSKADILIVAMGKPEFITADMVKEGAVVIDVGTTRVPSSETKSGFRLKGDVKFSEVSPKCSYITPVPGGVGPMTIVGLLQNTLKAAKKEVYQ
jgi:methylenetetrahydrofolate dehydrogenase (NADP+)/methenyltetrahydrofolate cyclohydrolase